MVRRFLVKELVVMQWINFSISNVSFVIYVVSNMSVLHTGKSSIGFVDLLPIFQPFSCAACLVDINCLCRVCLYYGLYASDWIFKQLFYMTFLVAIVTRHNCVWLWCSKIMCPHDSGSQDPVPHRTGSWSLTGCRCHSPSLSSGIAGPFKYSVQC